MGESSIAERYQRLSLLHRMSLELFADKPFPDALAAACRIALALTGARAVAVYFTDARGLPALALRSGEGGFADETAAAEELATTERAFADRRLTAMEGGEGRRWLAAPLLRIAPRDATVAGAVVFGHDRPPEDDPDRDTTLVEIARVLRDARLIRSALQQQKIFAKTFERAGDAIVIVGLDARALMWNRSAEELFQWTSAEMLGRDVRALVPPGRERSWRRLAARARRAGAIRGAETVCRRKDGSLVPAEVTGAMLLEDDGTPFGAVLAFRDITQRKEVERLKTEFVALVSHELRTPLTAIQGFAETIFDYWDEITPEQRRHYLAIIRDESKRLSSMVTDFLDIARLEAGGIEMSRGEVDLPALLRRAAELFKENPKRPRFEVSVAPGAERVNGDEEQLYRLLVNLAGNAVKYTDEGGVVTLAAARDGGSVVLSVADRGPGIAAEDLEKLFQKFFRASDAVALKTPGTGLGLAICKGIADAHGGRIWAESEPGRGATFKVSLPRREPGA
ncbi:MAG TPA: ATP-binding protein [Elusimicrobiota bacterium]|nr:ATP-binding protein [Elusimicrobiota bacterium]